jgi:hypothetical protein
MVNSGVDKALLLTSAGMVRLDRNSIVSRDFDNGVAGAVFPTRGEVLVNESKLSEFDTPVLLMPRDAERAELGT